MKMSFLIPMSYEIVAIYISFVRMDTGNMEYLILGISDTLKRESKLKDKSSPKHLKPASVWTKANQ